MIVAWSFMRSVSRGLQAAAIRWGGDAPRARPLLVLGVLIGAHAKNVAVEAACALGVLRGDADEVERLEECHARQSVTQPPSGSRKAPGAASTAGSGLSLPLTSRRRLRRMRARLSASSRLSRVSLLAQSASGQTPVRLTRATRPSRQ